MATPFWQKIQQQKRRKRRSSRKPSPLSVEQMLVWADVYRQRTGSWQRNVGAAPEPSSCSNTKVGQAERSEYT